MQPNIDPYNEQYSAPPTEVLGRILKLADEKTDSLTDYIIAPESAIQEYVWEDQIDLSESAVIMKQYISKHKHVAIVIGVSSRKLYQPGKRFRPQHENFRMLISITIPIILRFSAIRAAECNATTNRG